MTCATSRERLLRFTKTEISSSFSLGLSISCLLQVNITQEANKEQTGLLKNRPFKLKMSTSPKAENQQLKAGLKLEGSVGVFQSHHRLGHRNLDPGPSSRHHATDRSRCSDWWQGQLQFAFLPSDVRVME